jgi:hypothetical protein
MSSIEPISFHRFLGKPPAALIAAGSFCPLSFAVHGCLSAVAVFGHTADVVWNRSRGSMSHTPSSLENYAFKDFSTAF